MKLENILLTEDCRTCKIADFGLAGLVNAGASAVTDAGTEVSTNLLSLFDLYI